MKVIAYSGYRGEEKPRCFFVEDKRVNVDEIISEWREESAFFYRVKCSDEKEYILVYDLKEGKWRMAE